MSHREDQVHSVFWGKKKNRALTAIVPTGRNESLSLQRSFNRKSLRHTKADVNFPEACAAFKHMDLWSGGMGGGGGRLPSTWNPEPWRQSPPLSSPPLSSSGCSATTNNYFSISCDGQAASMGRIFSIYVWKINNKSGSRGRGEACHGVCSWVKRQRRYRLCWNEDIPHSVTLWWTQTTAWQKLRVKYTTYPADPCLEKHLKFAKADCIVVTLHPHFHHQTSFFLCGEKVPTTNHECNQTFQSI